MNMDDIIATREELDNQLKVALSTMERKDSIQKIRLDILKNQRRCPHFSNQYNWAIIDDTCPYCGLHFTNEREYGRRDND